jgi:hypothetical protein
MGDALEASAERVLDHLRRPIPGRGDLLTDDAGNTVSEIDPQATPQPTEGQAEENPGRRSCGETPAAPQLSDTCLPYVGDQGTGVCVSVRGWVNCAEGQEALVREIVDRNDDGFYSRGWSTLTGPNGSVCVFFGGTIHEQAVDWLLDQVRAIALVSPPMHPEDRIRGLFLVHDEMHGMQEWQVRDGQLVVEPIPDRYDYLYA